MTPDARREILRAVSAERERQDAKWGGVPGLERRDDHTYAAVLGEEFGEVCQAWLERNVAALRQELVQTAAVAVAWIEELDNGGARARPHDDPGRLEHRGKAAGVNGLTAPGSGDEA